MDPFIKEMIEVHSQLATERRPFGDDYDED
jgi:hypothetical protein